MAEEVSVMRQALDGWLKKEKVLASDLVQAQCGQLIQIVLSELDEARGIANALFHSPSEEMRNWDRTRIVHLKEVVAAWENGNLITTAIANDARMNLDNALGSFDRGRDRDASAYIEYFRGDMQVQLTGIVANCMCPTKEECQPLRKISIALTGITYRLRDGRTFTNQRDLIIALGELEAYDAGESASAIIIRKHADDVLLVTKAGKTMTVSEAMDLMRSIETE